MPYRVLIAPTAEAQLRQLHPGMRRRVGRALDRLKVDPRDRRSNVRQLRPPLEGWRVRVGDWRVLYLIDDEAHLVTAWRIGHRRDVYQTG